MWEMKQEDRLAVQHQGHDGRNINEQRSMDLFTKQHERTRGLGSSARSCCFLQGDVRRTPGSSDNCKG
ncbi:uncharacterized [Tachysurus ichikawai]